MSQISGGSFGAENAADAWRRNLLSCAAEQCSWAELCECANSEALLMH